MSQNDFLRKNILSWSVLCFLTIGAFLFLSASGCTIRKSDIPWLTRISENPLPENIFMTFPDQYHLPKKIMVFEFESPDYAPSVGIHASEILMQHLYKNRLFKNILHEPGKLRSPLDEKLGWARQNGCSLVIIGKINYYYEGSMLQESRVDEEIKIWDVRYSELVWHAEAIAIGRPVSENDYTLLTIKGEKAYSGMSLLALNAVKFCNLLAQPPYYKNLSQDMKWVDMGFRQLMVTQNYNQAEQYFQMSLKTNPDNAHAFFYLGIVYEKQSKPKAAMRMYQKVVELNPQDIITETNIPELMGRPLVDLAKYHLEQLEKIIP